MRESTWSDAGPAPTQAERRPLVKRGHALKAQLVVGRAGVTEAFLRQVRSAFANTDLLKVRLEAEKADDSERLALELADRVRCHLVQRVGRVALLYRKQAEKSE